METTRKPDIMCQQEQYRLWKQIKYFFCFKLILNNSWNVFKQISSLLTKHSEIELTCRAAMFCPLGKGLWDSWFLVPLASPGYSVPVLDMLCFSSIRCGCPRYAVPVLDTHYLSSIRCACLRYVVPVLNTLSSVLSLCLSLIRCASSQYAVPVLNMLSWPFAVPVPIRNWILILIPLYTRAVRTFNTVW